MLDQRAMERLSEDLYRRKQIPDPVHCRRCGYNLQSLPYMHRCPECGSSYDARPSHLKGIFQEQLLEFPFVDVFVFVLGSFLAGTALIAGQSRDDRTLFVLGLAYVGVALVLGARAVRQLQRYLHACAVHRRIRREARAAEDSRG